MSGLSKRQKSFAGKVDKTVFNTLTDAVKLAKECATAKFDESVELAFVLGVDPRHADQMVRGAVSLPHGTGKDLRVVVFCKQEEQVKAAQAAGALEVGAEELVERVAAGWTDFDAVVASPDMMGQVGKLGRVLGPRGLMPSPKAGTVTPNVGNAVTEIKKGKIEFRVDKNANIHVPIGKASFTEDMLRENAAAVINGIIKAKPSAARGQYLKGCTMSSTMGPGFRMDPATLPSQIS
jgi:large subunit ribosomal protein L1